MTMPVPTDSTQELTTAAIAGARRMFRDGYRYKKAGVILIDLTSADQVQTDLFDSRDREADNRISAALDRINGRLGTGTLHYAAEGIKKPWHTKFAMRSPRYTTRWDELPVVKAI